MLTNSQWDSLQPGAKSRLLRQAFVDIRQAIETLPHQHQVTVTRALLDDLLSTEPVQAPAIPLDELDCEEVTIESTLTMSAAQFAELADFDGA